jgi:uncharacterized membrane protein YciS (DUF1049 family)
MDKLKKYFCGFKPLKISKLLAVLILGLIVGQVVGGSYVIHNAIQNMAHDSGFNSIFCIYQ